MQSAAKHNDYEKADEICKEFNEAFPEHFYQFCILVINDLQKSENERIGNFMSSSGDLSKYPNMKEFMKRVIASKRVDDEINAQRMQNYESLKGN